MSYRATASIAGYIRDDEYTDEDLIELGRDADTDIDAGWIIPLGDSHPETTAAPEPASSPRRNLVFPGGGDSSESSFGLPKSDELPSDDGDDDADEQ